MKTGILRQYQDQAKSLIKPAVQGNRSVTCDLPN